MSSTDDDENPLKIYKLISPYYAKTIIKENRIYSFTIVAKSEDKARYQYPYKENDAVITFLPLRKFRHDYNLWHICNSVDLSESCLINGFEDLVTKPENDELWTKISTNHLWVDANDNDMIKIKCLGNADHGHKENQILEITKLNEYSI